MGNQEPDPLVDNLDAATAPDDLDRALARAKNAETERNQARAALAVSERENEELRRVAEYSKLPLTLPKWLRPRKRSDEHQATVVAFLSDLHLDEVVQPAEVDNRNAFNRHIAEQRMERFFTGTIKLAREYLKGLTYDGAVLMLGGDMVSGEIHGELTESNETGVLETVRYWTGHLAAGVKMLADEFGKVYVPCVVGNHGRRSLKPRMKKRAKDNYDHDMYHRIAQYFDNDDRVQFAIPDGTDVVFSVYDWTCLLTHGDQAMGGGGIAGVWAPIMKLRARKLNRFDFDTMAIGHWHSYIHAPEQGLIVNGTLKGWDEFSAIHNFPPERAQQAMFVVTPEHNVTFAAPVIVQDKEAEGW